MSLLHGNYTFMIMREAKRERDRGLHGTRNVANRSIRRELSPFLPGVDVLLHSFSKSVADRYRSILPPVETDLSAGGSSSGRKNRFA